MKRVVVLMAIVALGGLGCALPDEEVGPAADGGTDAAADGGIDAAADGGIDAAADGGIDAENTGQENTGQENTGQDTEGDPGVEATEAGSGGSGSEGPSVEVERLSDGDSGWFRVDGEEVEVRLLGYNAPERYENDAATEPGCNGQKAEQALARLLDGAATVELRGSETDRFGRTLADLDLDGASAVSTLILGGYGLALGDGPDRDLMKEAAADRRGMWGDQCGTPAAQGLVVDRVEPNPPGPDEDDLNGEWVELYNEGDTVIDFTGWDIRDDSSSNRFSLSGRLEPGASVIVRTGSGSSGGGELYLGSDSPVWSNRTDSVLVIDPNGVVAAWAFVDG